MSQPDVQALLGELHAALAAAAEDPAQIEEIRRVHTGKKSPLKEALRGLKDLAPEARVAFAQAVNAAQAEMEAAIDAALERAHAAALARRLDAEWLDLSLPGRAPKRGMRHPLTDTETRCLDLLRRLGFELVDGPEVESAFYNFDALNIPQHHPARDMQDTFWVDGGLLLRSHTTTVQARVLEARPPLPIRVASMGRVYRNEAVDATHLAMFHQFEGLWIDKGLTFTHLKGVLGFIARALYGDRPIRFKPKFYPYTEPSVGVDIQCGSCAGAGCEACHHAGWVTILGAGMVHPKVLEPFGYDPREITGIAFGLGTTRMAAQSAGVAKVRSLYEQDLRVLRALHRRDA